MEIDFADVLTETMRYGASDLHITAGLPPMVRVHGKIKPIDGFPRMTAVETRSMIYTLLNNAQRQALESDRQVDFAYSAGGAGRFRVNCYFQRGALAAALRVIPSKILTLEELSMPPALADFTQKPRGLVLVTGPTGSGKSTTLAAMLDLINRTRDEHIMTVEDPIEFLHRHQRCVVNQREVGSDTRSFSLALRAALRQDPDVILVGEMRDLETISTALSAAETGHLVFGTLHTQSAPQTIDRIIDVFPPQQQQQIRLQLASTLQGVVSQQLLRTADGRGRVSACEVLSPTAGVRNLIREGKTHQIYSAIQTGASHGMQTMDAALAALTTNGVITRQQAETRTSNPEELQRLISGQAQAQMAQV